MKFAHIKLLAVIAGLSLLCPAQTLYVPGGTVGTSANGNVGIGTTAPGAKLHIKETDGTTPLAVEGTQSNAFIGMYPDQALFLYSTLQATAANPTRSSVYLALRGNYWTGSTYTSADVNIQNVVSGANVYRMAFRTANTERMAIDQAGNVGIGTTTPLSKLHVMGVGRFGVNTPSINNIGGVLIASGTGAGGARQYWIGASSPTAHNNSMFEISDYNGSTNYPLMTIYGAHAGSSAGNVGIGTTSPSHKLSVNGAIRAKEVIVDTGWSDYVFSEDYRLAPLQEVEAHIKSQRHLPGIPSAAQVAENGVSLGEMQAKLLAKIEELTLHLIAQEKTISEQAARIERLESRRIH